MTSKLQTSPTPPTNGRGGRSRHDASQRAAKLTPDPHKLIRWGIWVYLILWLIEGGLRRWFLPGLAAPLLIVREPVVVAIYYLCWSKGVWPRSNILTVVAVLAPLSFMNALILGHHNLLVAAYGVRCDFLHVPLIFVVARILRLNDLDKLFKVALWISIPYSLLLLLQFYSPQSAWVNRGLGGDIEGAGFSGAMGFMRPPGTFSFITGVSQLYPLFAAAWFYLLLRKKLPFILMSLSGAAILMAVPLSISRSLLVGIVIVAAFGLLGLGRQGLVSVSLVLKAGLGIVVALVLVANISGVATAIDAFAMRWENSTTNRGGVEEALVGRVVDGMLNPFANVGLIGVGTGLSTQVGQKLATGRRGFGYSEGEFGRILWEGGLLLGTAILAVRISLLWVATYHCFVAFARGQAWSLPLLAAAAPSLLIGQWGQTTSLGSSVIAAGLALAAAKVATPRQAIPLARKRTEPSARSRDQIK